MTGRDSFGKYNSRWNDNNETYFKDVFRMAECHITYRKLLVMERIFKITVRKQKSSFQVKKLSGLPYRQPGDLLSKQVIWDIV